jgi:chorismate synthase
MLTELQTAAGQQYKISERHGQCSRMQRSGAPDTAAGAVPTQLVKKQAVKVMIHAASVTASKGRSNI